MGKAILYRMNSGIPGDLTRMQSAGVESIVLDPVNLFVGYGLPGKIVAGKFTPIALNDVVAAIYGFLARPFPTSGSDAAGLLPSVVSGAGSVMRNGYMAVKNNAGVPALNGQVYVRVANPNGAKVVGGVEAAAEPVAVGAITGGNTGNGTIGTVSATAAAIIGAYKATMTAATTFQVTDPNGVQLKVGATGVAYTAGGITFTITVGGTPMVAGDSFTVTPAQNTVAVPQCSFMSAADASGNVEIQFNVI